MNVATDIDEAPGQRVHMFVAATADASTPPRPRTVRCGFGYPNRSKLSFWRPQTAACLLTDESFDKPRPPSAGLAVCPRRSLV